MTEDKTSLFLGGDKAQTLSKLPYRPHNFLFSGYREGEGGGEFARGVKRPGHDADNSFFSGADFKTVARHDNLILLPSWRARRPIHRHSYMPSLYVFR